MGRGDKKDSRKNFMKNHQTENDMKKRKLEDINQILLSNENSKYSRDRNLVCLCKQRAVNDNKNIQTYNKFVGKGLNSVH